MAAAALMDNAGDQLLTGAELAGDTAKIMKELGYELPTKTYANYTIMGKEFD